MNLYNVVHFVKYIEL